MRSRYLNLLPLLGPTLSSLLLCMLAFNALADNTNQKYTQLREHYTQLIHAREGLQHSLARGELNQTEIADYRAWIQQLDTLVLQGCQQSGVADNASLLADLPCDQILLQGTSPANIDTRAEATATEKTALIVDQLSASLGQFDEQLLQEQERIKAKIPRSDSSSHASAGGDSSSVAESSNSSSGSGDYSTSTGTTTESKSTQNQDQSSEKNTTAAPGPRGSAQKTSNTTPEDIPDGSDDDVVARQIREAAEKERDPQLKEKLWEEYRRYKAGTG